MCKLSDASVYVGTYGKYNDGSLAGKWLDIADYASEEEFYEACAELHKDEPAGRRELMFQDWSNVPCGLISESSISDVLFGLVQEAQSMSDEEQEALAEWLADHGCSDRDTADDLVEEFRDDYVGDYDREEDFAQEMVDEGMFGDIPENIASYIDYEAIARDLFINDYSYSNGHVYRRS